MELPCLRTLSPTLVVSALRACLQVQSDPTSSLYTNRYLLDTFELADSTGTAIEIKSTGIAWSVDINSKFKHNDDWKDTQWYDVEDGRGFF